MLTTHPRLGPVLTGAWVRRVLALAISAQHYPRAVRETLEAGARTRSGSRGDGCCEDWTSLGKASQRRRQAWRDDRFAPDQRRAKNLVQHLKHSTESVVTMLGDIRLCLRCMWELLPQRRLVPYGHSLLFMMDFLVYVCRSHWQQSQSRPRSPRLRKSQGTQPQLYTRLIDGND